MINISYNLRFFTALLLLLISCCFSHYFGFITKLFEFLSNLFRIEYEYVLLLRGLEKVHLLADLWSMNIQSVHLTGRPHYRNLVRDVSPLIYVNHF